MGIANLDTLEIIEILNLAEEYIHLNNSSMKRSDILSGKTLVNMFFESSTRTQASFELAGKRLGADVMNFGIEMSSVRKGETLIDTAMTLNAMQPDLLVVRHPSSGAANLLSEKVNCSVINAGDGSHEHPTQALLDALTIKFSKGTISGLKVAICGDILHSRVARSNIFLLSKFKNLIHLVAPQTLMPSFVEELGVTVHDNLIAGIQNADVVMMLRLQSERMQSSLIPSLREYYHLYGLDREKLEHAQPDAIVMHPGPMNRGVEIDGTLADDINISVIQHQVEFGVATRMAVMDLLCQKHSNTSHQPKLSYIDLI